MPQNIRFTQPELNWVAGPGSFENMVAQIIQVRLANPHQVEKHKWPVDHDGVASELDSYFAKICIAQGWVRFVINGANDAPLTGPSPRWRRDEAGKASKCCGAK